MWDASHKPEHDPDDAAVWGEFGERQERWPGWILVGATVYLIQAAPWSGGPGASAVAKLLQAAGSGFAIGAYLALEFFHAQPFVQVGINVAIMRVYFREKI